MSGYENIGITSVPTDLLPATNLYECDYCYDCMFDSSQNLENAPNLPAEVLCKECYNEMFKECKSLTSVPTLLPATNLVEGCYKNMFSSCEKLETAPILPASILATSCYESMFNGCSLLQNLSVGFSSFESLPENATDGWLNGTSNGTFTWSGLTSIDTRNADTVPISWTIVNP